MREHFEELFNTSVWELKFANLQIEHLKASLHEIQVIVKDPLIERVIENSLERSNLDKFIHTRLLFGKNPQWFKKNVENAKSQKA